jgi:hypothetical protein
MACCAACDVAEGGDAEADGGGAACPVVELGELGVGGGEADAQALGFPGPAFAFGFGDAVGQIAADLLKPGALGRVRAQERAPDAAVLMLAACSPGTPAVAQGNPAALEVAEELVPFGVGGGAVFFGGAELSAAVDEGAVAVDGFFGVDG